MKQNGGDTVFFVLCTCMCAQRTGQSDSWVLIANSSKTVKAMDFRFGMHVSRDIPFKYSQKMGVCGQG